MADVVVEPASPEPLSPKSGHDSWPPLVGDSERADPSAPLPHATVVTPRGELPREPVAAASEEAEPDADTTRVQAHERGKPGKPISPFQKRINQAVAAQREAERRAEEAQAKLRELEAQRQPSATAPQAAPQTQEPAFDPNRPEPKLDGYKTYEEWVRAQVRWEQDRSIQALLQTAAQAQQVQAQQTATQAFETRKAAWIADHPDFPEVAQAAGNVQVSPVMDAFFKQDEHGMPVLDYLVRNPEEASAIARLATGPAFIALGRLVERLGTPTRTTGAASSPTYVPRAPAPLSPVGSGPHRSLDPSDLDFGPEYVRRNNEAERQRRRAGLR